MKTFRIDSARNGSPKSEDIIRVYRRHAARAIAEERWHAAEIFLDRILEVEPEHTEAWLMKGLLRQHCREDETAAVECFRTVISLCHGRKEHPHADRAQRSLDRILV